MTKKLTKLSAAVMGVLFTGGAVAAETQDQGGVNQNNAARSGVINAGGFEIQPKLGLSIGRNDNVGLTNVKTATNFTMLNPSVNIGLPIHGQMYTAKYSGTLARMAGSSIDNYNDHNFGLIADNTWSARLNTLVNADYIKGHDGRNAVMFRNKELWHNMGVKGMVHYGAEGAQGQFELAAGQSYKRYDSNNGGSTQLFNYDKTDLSGTFFYKVAPATQMIVEAGNAKFSYVDAASKRLDSNEQRLMLGAKWEATAKTTGEVKVGKMNKTFSLGLLPSGSSTVWDGMVTWSPKTYSKVDLSMHQKSNEYGGVGSFVISRDTDLAWTHDWSGYVRSALSFGDGVDTYQAATRVDKRQKYGLKVTYEINRWLTAGVDFQHSKRNSTNNLFSYTQSVSMLTLEGSL